MVRNAIAHWQAIFQDGLSGREIKLYNFMTVTTRVNDIDVGSLVNTFEVTMKVDYFFSPYFEGINDLLGPGWAGRRADFHDFRSFLTNISFKLRL